MDGMSAAEKAGSIGQILLTHSETRCIILLDLCKIYEKTFPVDVS